MFDGYNYFRELLLRCGVCDLRLENRVCVTLYIIEQQTQFYGNYSDSKVVKDTYFLYNTK